NFLNAARRVTDWAMFLASSSNWLFITYLSSVESLQRENVFRHRSEAATGTTDLAKTYTIEITITPKVRFMASASMQLLRSLGTGRSSQQGQGHAGDADAEFPQRSAPCQGLSHSFGQVIELIVHRFPFGFGPYIGVQAIHELERAPLTKK